MADLLTQVGSILTALVGWCGSILTFVVAQPLLLIPASLGLIGSAAIFIKKVRQ